MRQPFRVSVWVLVGLVAFAGVLLIAFRARQRMPTAPMVSITFLGYTNAPPGMTYAIFSVTNTSKRTVKVLPGCTIDVEGRNVPLVSAVRTSAQNLRPGRGMIAVVGFPSVETKWRGRWGVSWNDLHERLSDFGDRWQLPLLQGGHYMYAATSDWLTGPRSNAEPLTPSNRQQAPDSRVKPGVGDR